MGRSLPTGLSFGGAQLDETGANLPFVQRPLSVYSAGLYSYTGAYHRPCGPIEEFALYQPSLLRNLDWNDHSRVRIVFHDCAFRSILPLPAKLQGYVFAGRVELYAQADKAHFDDLLIVTKDGDVHTRIEEEGEGIAIAQFRQSEEHGHILNTLFTGILDHARRLMP